MTYTPEKAPAFWIYLVHDDEVVGVYADDLDAYVATLVEKGLVENTDYTVGGPF